VGSLTSWRVTELVAPGAGLGDTKVHELSVTKIYEPSIRARLGSSAYFCEVEVLVGDRVRGRAREGRRERECRRGVDELAVLQANRVVHHVAGKTGMLCTTLAKP